MKKVLFSLALVAFGSLAFIGSASATVGVPTTITNAPKAQFIGSMVTANGEKTSLVPTTVTHVNAEFKDCAACNTWFANSNVSGLAAKFTSATMQTSWGKSGLIGFVGSCVDSQTGLSCAVPE